MMVKTKKFNIFPPFELRFLTKFSKYLDKSIWYNNTQNFLTWFKSVTKYTWNIIVKKNESLFRYKTTPLRQGLVLYIKQIHC